MAARLSDEAIADGLPADRERDGDETVRTHAIDSDCDPIGSAASGRKEHRRLRGGPSPRRDRRVITGDVQR